MSGCLDEDAIFEFTGGGGDEAARERVEIHIDECSECRGLVAEAARRDREPGRSGSVEIEDTLLDTGEPLSAAADLYPRAGTRIDRYTVERILGAGGMGVVLLAADPELDRPVTIKLLRPELADPADTRGARARLLREAQAMAKLSHPNVVPIFDIGTWNDQVFIAMEYLDGGTLGRRLDSALEPDEVIALFLAAGRGLAAAHAAGLIHRDFKPANVMLSRAGAVKVTDFGLALPGSEIRTAARGEPAAQVAGSDSSLTRTGAVVGTPAYMAPEQMQGARVDVRSDIFSFCVALHEGLYGTRPFAGDTTGELLSAALERRLEPPAREPRLPERVKAIVARGIEPDPADRPRSMAEVLEALAPRRGGRWRVVAAAAAVLAAGAVIAAGVGWARAGDEPLDLVATTCSNGAQRFDPSWNPELSTAIDRTLRESGVKAAETTARTVRRQLDRYRDEWIGVHRTACTATRLSGEQSVELLERQTACLERRRAEVDRAVAALEMVTGDSATSAAAMVAGLTSPAVCSSVAAMAREPPEPADAETRKRVLQLRVRLSKAHAKMAAGELEEALAIAVAASAEARDVNFAPVEAEAWLARGQVESLLSRYDDALASFRETIQIAQLGNHDRARADAYVGIIDLQISRAELDEAERWLRYARDALAQVTEDPDAEADLAARSALLHRARGDVKAALADGERSLALRRMLHGERSPEIGRALFELAGIHANAANDHAAAVPLYRQSLEMLTDLYGASHERLLEPLTGLAASLSITGEHDEALAVFDRRGELLAQVLGEENPMLVSFRADRASYLDRAGRHAEAMAELDAAVAGAARVFGEGSREHIDSLVLRGGRHYLADRHDRAHADLSRGVVMADKLWGPSGEATLIYRNLLGTNLTAAGRLDEARLELAANVVAAEKALSADAPLYVDALARLAKAERLAGETARATRRLERALSRLGAQPNTPLEAFVRWQLGQSLGSGARAVELVEIARRFYASPAGDSVTAGEIDEWLARRVGDTGGGERDPR